MSDDKARFTTHEANPFLTPPIVFQDVHAAQQERVEQKKISQAASSEQAEREDALLRAINPPRMQRIEPPSLRAPVLPDGFAEQAAALDEEIFNRGVAIDRDRLVSLGRQRFAELLALDRTARSLQRVLINDFSSFASVESGFSRVSPLIANVPRRRTADVVAGRGLDREAVSKIESFDDVWKATTAHAPTIRNIYNFRGTFETLIFGESMFERLSRDGRVRSRLFCGGHGRKVALFNNWLGALDAAHVKITIEQPIFSAIAWVSGEKTPCADATELARDFFNMRAPAQTQLALAQPIFEGFLLGKNSWDLWQHVGNAARVAIEHDHLEVWRKELARRYSAITHFHDTLRGYFFREVSSHGHGHHQFDAAAHRNYVERELHKLVDFVSLLAAQAVEETGVCMARFSDWLLVEGKPETVSTEKISSQLAAAFRGATFNVTVEEIGS